jgi:uncharacterized protein YwgA
MAYLAGSLFSLDLGHHAYFYGPYSASIEGDVEALWLSDLIDEKRRRLGINSNGFEVARYEYSLTDAGQQRLKQIREAFGAEYSDLEKFVNHVSEKAGSFHQNILSAVAKVHFIETMENERLKPQQVRELAKNLGWKLSEDQIQRVQEISDEIQEFTLQSC